ncbi:olfactomedin-4-like isoform X2 [Syngnathoides biaculeatus]|uniref:olfactomedin-4-like isoform X2 n=1 Tax=Syngnathoides biaculeatus TaxID=300417 RepID=UPI002ADD410B|nr:olfactomedin-4-like isoform X2 [Syngnathoides biaculeatus]
MKLYMIIALCSLFNITQQLNLQDRCTCELTNKEKPFPQETLKSVNDKALNCSQNVTPQKALELESLMLGLKLRLPQLLKDVSILEKEDDGELYGAISLQVIENELTEIKRMVNSLNRTTKGHQYIATGSERELVELRAELQEMEQYDTFQVERQRKDNQRLKRALDECRIEREHKTQPTDHPESFCPHGRFVNITGPGFYSTGNAPATYKYGGWGRDPKPGLGKEKWYWRVMLTNSNRYGHYISFYTSLSSLTVGINTPGNAQIHPANPTTNTIQGPNVVLYGEALYYNCYNSDQLCRFNITSKTISNLQLPKGTRFNSKANFCHIDECYPYTDFDMATDESGVWLIYSTTQNYGNLVLSKVEEGDPPMLSQTWHTSIYKQGVTNTFMACGILYATRYISQDMEEIFYSFDTSTGVERFNLGIFMNKMCPNILFLNYSPVDQMLHVYCDANMVSYKALFE